MKLVAWMGGASWASWLAAAAVVDARMEMLLGMIGPLVVASVAWAVMERVYRRDPQRLTRVMIGAFAGKMVFFGAYVAVVIAGWSLRPIPFVVSFVCYFLALHLTEAVALRRLVSGSMRASG
jgi:hypothetical protein